MSNWLVSYAYDQDRNFLITQKPIFHLQSLRPLGKGKCVSLLLRILKLETRVGFYSWNLALAEIITTILDIPDKEKMNSDNPQSKNNQLSLTQFTYCLIAVAHL